MPGDPTVSQRLLAAVQALRESQDQLPNLVRDAVQAERTYRMAKAKALLQSHGPNAMMREANAEVMVVGTGHEGEAVTLSDVRFQRDLAEGLRISALEAVRSHRAIVSALQSLAAVERSEIEFAKYGPQEAWGATP